MSDEEIKAIEYLKGYKYQNEVSEAIQTVLNLIEKQKEDIKEYEAILDIGNNRKYRKKYLEERRKEEPNLLYPDADEIYERYYKQKAEIEELKAKLEYKQYNDLDNIEFEKYIEKIVKERTEKLYKEIETLKRDFEIVDHECSRLEQEDIRKDKIINDAIKWIENTMNDTRVIGCNLGDLQLLLDILKDKK